MSGTGSRSGWWYTSLQVPLLIVCIMAVCAAPDGRRWTSRVSGGPCHATRTAVG